MDKNTLSKTSRKFEGKLLCLCLTAACLSAPLNGLSPSLTLVALEFGYNEKERDIYLGGYIGLSTMLGQMVGSCISGLLENRYPRKVILIASLLLGSMAMILFGVIRYYPLLLFCRIITGACQGMIVPVLFSLIGDYYSVDERATYSAIVSSCLGGGMMLGQLFTGYTLGLLGWRYPFVIMGIYTLFSALVLQVVLREPQRGAKEDDLAEILSKGFILPPLSIATFFYSMSIPTVAIMLIQTIPNTVPW
jgi:MFS family permease